MEYISIDIGVNLKTIVAVALANTAVIHNRHNNLLTTEIASRLNRCDDIVDIVFIHDRDTIAKAGVALWRLQGVNHEAFKEH